MSSIKNYFEFFGLEERFDIDLDELRKNFISKSKEFHPDFHTDASEEEQERILEISTVNNEGWKILSDLQHRIAHILQLKEAMPEEGKAQVPQDFLMEMMEINEALMELEFEENASDKNKILTQLEELENALHKEGKAAMDQWDKDQVETGLSSVRDYYLKLKYINRIKERLK